MTNLKDLSEEYVTMGEAARRLGVTKVALSRRISRGTLPYVEIGKKSMYGIPAWAIALELAERENAALRAQSAN